MNGVKTVETAKTAKTVKRRRQRTSSSNSPSSPSPSSSVPPARATAVYTPGVPATGAHGPGPSL